MVHGGFLVYLNIDTWLELVMSWFLGYSWMGGFIRWPEMDRLLLNYGHRVNFILKVVCLHLSLQSKF